MMMKMANAIELVIEPVDLEGMQTQALDNKIIL